MTNRIKQQQPNMGIAAIGFEFGPIEWVWRNLSYQKMHAFRKTEIVQEEINHVSNDVDVVPVPAIIKSPSSIP